ncbi:hypothetical protein AKG60_24380 [Vibrio parahaemolyticus]|uniref:Uncharacterized protein n=2 Tax=Vibrio TaxID=662 RepID=A0AAX0M5Q1_VIBPH|nr:hypothetical protein [Vibrio vulnificus]EGQ8891209.1 hypothetical protein [Vibrio parahaemolyticus]MCS0330381.1 hypothetical protein [Vibrio diabolicus]ARN69766.1 hypothetical protein FORC36_5249 [Vibrio vulnificus]AXX63560.1 hypothetical protein FORC53_5221 [Vibrio vulnificus]EGR2855638.1 hypothetical protein [Vibrio parahaemolyticus]
MKKILSVIGKLNIFKKKEPDHVFYLMPNPTQEIWFTEEDLREHMWRIGSGNLNVRKGKSRFNGQV